MKEGRSTEESLMAAYAAGDREAFARLFARLAPAVHGFFMRSFGNAAVADDLLQTTFLKVHRARGDYDPRLPLRPWLFTIAARVRVDELRRRYALPETASEEELARADEAQSVARAGEGETERGDRAAVVRAALARLPESQRAVVHLHRYEGMTFPEIARVLGTTEGAVKLRAFRAYERLRDELRDLVAGPKAAGPARAGAGQGGSQEGGGATTPPGAR
jgi:RNA polymerase sigma-70 factor (ECF subfamily)